MEKVSQRSLDRKENESARIGWDEQSEPQHYHFPSATTGTPPSAIRQYFIWLWGAKLTPSYAGWAGAMMLEHLGYPDAAAALLRAIETVLAEGPRTPDMGGDASTTDVGKAIAEAAAKA